MAGHIIAVVGGKGGVGKSVFAANLAIAYLQEFKQRPLIVDLDMNSLGDQNIILGQNPPKNIVDVSKMPGGPIDPRRSRPFMVNAPAGYSYIGAPSDAIYARDIDVEGIGRFMKAVTNVFNLVVVDCGNGMDPWALKTLEYATAIFVVTTADVIVINQTKRVLGKIQELLFPPEMVQIVVNRYNQANIINPQMIQKNLNRTIFAAVPEDVATCDGSLAKSTPLCIAAANTPISRAYHDIVRKIQQVNLLDNLAKLKKPTGVVAKAAAADRAAGSAPGATPRRRRSPARARPAAPLDPWTAMKLRIHKALVEQMDLKKMNTDTSDPKQRAILREKTQKGILDILTDRRHRRPAYHARAQGPDGQGSARRGPGPRPARGSAGRRHRDRNHGQRARPDLHRESRQAQLSKMTFSSEQQMMNVIERIVTPLGRRVDEKVPYVDARLQDGSRVHIIIPPLALRGPDDHDPKIPEEAHRGQKDLVAFGSMTEEIADFLRCCVEAKLNIVVSGGTGSGKTTLLNVLSNFIPATERIITVEDSAELQLGQEHVVRLETRPKNIEGEGEVSHPRPDQVLPAHASGPHRRRRVPRRRGARHASGHEHRPLGLADHPARQQSARVPCAAARRWS